MQDGRRPSNEGWRGTPGVGGTDGPLAILGAAIGGDKEGVGWFQI